MTDQATLTDAEYDSQVLHRLVHSLRWEEAPGSIRMLLPFARLLRRIGRFVTGHPYVSPVAKPVRAIELPPVIHAPEEPDLPGSESLVRSIEAAMLTLALLPRPRERHGADTREGAQT